MRKGINLKLNFSKDFYNKNDLMISITIMSSYAVLAAQFFVLHLFNLSGTGQGSLVQIISKVVVGILFIITLPTIIKRNLLTFVCVYFIAVFILLINLVFFPQNSEELLGVAFSLLFICLPCLIYSFSLNDNKILLAVIYKISNIVLILGMIIAILVLTKEIVLEDYSMALSYYLLLPTIVNMYRFIAEKSYISILKVIISLLIILMLGSRGPLLCFGIYSILAILKNNNKITLNTLLFYTSSAFSLLLGVIFFESIILKINDLLIRYGIFSRTLYLFIEEENIHLSGRNEIYQIITSHIYENPLLGIGIAGDRQVMGTYSHNIFIELLSGFGIIFGSLIILLIAWISLKGIFNKNKLDSNISIMLFSLGFIPLLVSGSYLTEFIFWIFLGITIKGLYNRKKISK
ncbi:hypothetical protein IM538_21595 [Cytobacillus suaedae]|nr:hypothetical protein IM538_21595 [Cytobacillus suaedae]